MVWPAAGPLNGTFGDRLGRMHYGIDIAASEGQPIMAAAHGIVVLVDEVDDYGTTTVVAHGGGVATVYGHQSETIVRCGEGVRQGDVIGLVGSTGRATGPHLHFEVRVDAIARDPVDFLPQPPGDDADGSPRPSGSATGG
jgi:murein DD-endopeptidase MepM/ murein hydrolase activator NlpD